MPHAVAEFNPDAVLLDLAMPDHSGSREDRQKTASSGFLHHVAKPYSADALLKLVLSITPR